MSETERFKKILIYRTGHLGDTLVSLPAFWAIRKTFPNAELTLLTNVDAENPNYVTARAVLPEKGLIDRWLFYPNSASAWQTATALLKLIFRLRKEKFDAVFYLMTRNRSLASIERDKKIFSIGGGIKHVFGADYLAQHRLDENAARPLADVEPESKFLLDCLPSERFSFDLNAAPDLRLTREENEVAAAWLSRRCGTDFENKILIAVAPGSKWESKIWSESRFAAVIKSLIDRFGVFPVIFGGKEDREKGERLLAEWGTGANAAGELNIRQAAAALQYCRLYLGNDTGTMHLAAAVGTACAAVFAAIDVGGRWRPYGSDHIIFREKVACEACYLEVCPFENRCLNAIGADEVIRACEKLLTR